MIHSYQLHQDNQSGASDCRSYLVAPNDELFLARAWCFGAYSLALSGRHNGTGPSLCSTRKSPVVWRGEVEGGGEHNLVGKLLQDA
jgi:hypothetical protein